MSDLYKRFPVYSRFLKLYPAAYRKAYGQQMLQTLADMLDNSVDSRQRAAVWLRTALDLPLSAARQQLVVTGDVLVGETPDYVKRSSLFGALLLLPFVLALSANALDKVIYNHTLYHSWLWSKPAASLWVLWLPRLATVLSLITLIVYLYQRSKKGSGSWIKQLIDIRRTWPMLVVAFSGLLILAIVFGHDKVQCLTKRNPAANWSATWQCLKNN